MKRLENDQIQNLLPKKKRNSIVIENTNQPENKNKKPIPSMDSFSGIQNLSFKKRNSILKKRTSILSINQINSHWGIFGMFPSNKNISKSKSKILKPTDKFNPENFMNEVRDKAGNVIENMKEKLQNDLKINQIVYNRIRSNSNERKKMDKKLKYFVCLINIYSLKNNFV